MTTRATIGDFSRASHLSVKTLRHYHEVGLLEPSEVDPDNGYRYYSEDQIPIAQVIRRLRGLHMPVADVKSVLAAPGSDERNRLIVEHLVVCLVIKWGLWYGGESAHLPLRLRLVTSSDRCSRS